MLESFQPDLFHLGGDEINFNCWNTTQEIADHLQNNLGGREEEQMMQLWGEFLEVGSIPKMIIYFWYQITQAYNSYLTRNFNWYELAFESLCCLLSTLFSVEINQKALPSQRWKTSSNHLVDQ